jgi:DNA-binding FadR family transcriptional regulator
MLESESLITISRGKHGGARVIAIDLGAAARQVGVYLQIEGATLQDVWLARTIIEPPAVGLLAERRDPMAFAVLEGNIAAAREVAQRDPIRYADLSAEFSMLITRHCGNKTIHLLASLIHDIIRRQHKDVTARTLSKAGVDKLRQGSIRSRERALELMRSGLPTDAESFWRAHLEHMRDLVLAAYNLGCLQITNDDRRVERNRWRSPLGQQRQAARATSRKGGLTFVASPARGFAIVDAGQPIVGRILRSRSCRLPLRRFACAQPGALSMPFAPLGFLRTSPRRVAPRASGRAGIDQSGGVFAQSFRNSRNFRTRTGRFCRLEKIT